MIGSYSPLMSDLTNFMIVVGILAVGFLVLLVVATARLHAITNARDIKDKS